MATNAKLSESLVEMAWNYGRVQHRSVPKQIEYWTQIGKIAEENPDLPFAMIRDILVAQQEVATEEYRFG
jgi:hypothetical protein